MTTTEKVIKNKMGLLKLVEQLGNVSQACKISGYSRDSFYRFKELYEEQGEEGLRELSRRICEPTLLVKFRRLKRIYRHVRITHYGKWQW